MAKKASKQQATLFGVEDSPAPAKPAKPAATATAKRPAPRAAASAEKPQRDVPLVYAIDAHSLIYQVFHALPEMSGPNGQPIGAIHGFIGDVVNIIEKQKPDYLFCAFDFSGDTFRHDLYTEYKAHREEMPADLQLQIPNIRRMLAAMNIPVLELDQYEADDILATMARECDERGYNLFVVTSDKDCRQFISDHVKLFNIRKQEVFDAARLMEDWGIKPEQVVDFQAMVGDSVDNVPGVPLIGPKIARELITQYGTLDEVLAHASEVAGQKRRENLINFRDQAILSRELVRLDRNVPIEIDWEAGRVGGVNRQAVAELAREFGFKRLGDVLASMAVADAPAFWEATYKTVATEADLDDLVQALSQQEWISVDTETTSQFPRLANIVGYSFAWKSGEGYYIPVLAPEGEPKLDGNLVREKLKPILENPAIKKIGQNLKYDIIVLRNEGIHLRGMSFDTMVADYLLDPGERSHNLDDLAKKFLNHKNIAIEALIGSGKDQRSMDQVAVALVTDYAAEDADVALRLKEILERRLNDDGLMPLFQSMEMPLIDVLADMEYAGIKIDVPRLKGLSGEFAAELARLEQEIYAIAGKTFNIDSPKQLAEILFDELKLPVTKRTRTGPSTDVDVLEELAAMHPLPAKIIEYRGFAKLKGTYVDALPELLHPITKRVHTSFKQDVAATGRLSSKDPNLQNIPIRTETGRQIRSAFIPGELGWKLLTADYSQIELRVLAHFSGDAALKQAFIEGQDIHTLVASQVYGVPLDQVTKDQRRSAKAINFGVIYGQSSFGLAMSLDIEKTEAAEFIDAYFARYPGVDNFFEQVLADARAKGYVSTISGRRRPVSGVRSKEYRGGKRQRNLPERIAINTVIQGSAADLIKQAMLNVWSRLKREGFRAKLLLQIHDELVFEAPEHELTQLAALVRDEMTRAGQGLSVALGVDVKTGDNWAECEPV
jgi:DNA polymerase-1